MHALIIEDDGLIAFYLDALLCDLGYACTWATTEEDAVTAARKRCPDLVAADLHLRAGDGQSAVRRIREQCPATTTPVVYVTGTPEALKDVPAAIVVAKPFDGEGLYRAIEAASA